MMTAGTKAVPAPAAKQRSQGRRGVLRELSRRRALYAMMLPGLLGFFIINYIPMGGAVIAFQDYNPVQGIFGSEFNGFENFRFFFESNSAVTVTVNTICYNLLFMVLGIGLGMFSAILISQLQQKRAAAFYKSVIFLPYLISWVVAAYLLFAILSVDKGILAGSTREQEHFTDFFRKIPVCEAVRPMPEGFSRPRGTELFAENTEWEKRPR